jgi:hypothetical protein
MTKLFFDTEFTGLHQKTTLISIGIVAESGETFYSEFTDYDKTQLDDWLNENIISKLLFTDKITNSVGGWESWDSEERIFDNSLEFSLADKDMKKFRCIGKTPMIKNRLEQWLKQFESIEMWSDCLAYDWVLFNNIWGHSFNIPKNIYYIPFDICPLLNRVTGDADINREEYAVSRTEGKEILSHMKEQKHNALWDAMVIYACYENVNETLTEIINY